MKKIILSLFTLTLAVSTYGFEREYVKRAVLTKEQEKTVIELAKKAGIKKVAKISSHNMFPSPFRGLRVQGVEHLKGREVSYQVLSLSHSEWLQPGAKPRKGQIQMGNFWAGKPYTKKQTILKVGKKEYRTRTVQGLSLEQAESMLGLLLTKNYIIEPAVNQANFEKIAWDKPMAFRKRAETFSISFPHISRGAGFFDLQIQIKNKELLIQQMFQAVP